MSAQIRPAVALVAPVEAWHPARQRHQRTEIDDRGGALMRAELGEDGRSGRILYRNGKQRAEDHVRRHMRHFLFDLDRLRTCLHVYPGHGGLPGRPHGGKGLAQPPAFEGGIDDPPLARPGLAVRDEDAVAQKRLQPLADAAGLRKVHRPALQHQIDQRGIVAEVGAEERRPELRHPGTVEPRGLGREDIVTKEPEIAPERHPVGPRGGLGRDHAACPWGLSGVSMRLCEGARPR